MPKHKFIWWIPFAALFLLACDISLGGIPQAKTGPVETVTINVPAPAGAADLTIAMGGGSLDLTGGAVGLVEGSVQTNVADWKPTVTTVGANVVVAQGQGKSPIADSTNTVNKWALKLGKTPMSLNVKAGATNGTLNLGGVPLRGLRIEQGAASTDIKFAAPNPEVMKEMNISAGASNIALSGLGNANFETLVFNGGASNYTLDFGGKLQRNATATVKTGVSNLTIVIPEGVNAKVTLTGGLRAANTEGAWQKSGDTYTQSGGGPALTVNVEMCLGALHLKNK